MTKKPLIEDSVLFDILDQRKKPAGARGGADNIIAAFENAGSDPKRAVIHIYDAISWWTGNDAATFKDKLAQIKAETIELRLNSPGGSVFEGVTIYNLLIAHPARVEVKVDGLAGSIASVIMLAGDDVEMAENAMVMIHNPSVVAWGESTELRKMADVLDSLKDAILNTYVSRTGGDRDELARMMSAETWFTADEAITHKFADKKFAPIKAAAHWPPDDFANLPENARQFGKPKAIAAAPDEPAPPEPPAPEVPASVGTVEDVANARDLVAKLRKDYGIA